MSACPDDTTDLTWVVPCWNEAHRLHDDLFIELVEADPRAAVVFVDDGSADETLARLHALAGRRPGRFDVLALGRNSGKAEAVRQGMLRALAGTTLFAGYADADLATPPSELCRLASIIRSDPADVLMGSRVQLLGRAIERSAARHYSGRVFATLASLSLRLPVYDTQCGAKLFRRGPALQAALERPFFSRWAFDVELLGRLLRPDGAVAPISPERIREEPLLRWTDVAGSKLRLTAALRTGLELAWIGSRLRRG